MSKRTFLRSFRPFLAVALLAAALSGFACSRRSDQPPAGPAESWFPEDELLLDMAQPPALAEHERRDLLASLKGALAGAPPASSLTVDYPFAQSILPPDMVPPTFLFRDADPGSKVWLVDLEIAGETSHVYVLTDGRKPEPRYDPRCGPLPEGYEEPELQRAAKGWTPETAVWTRLARFAERPVTVSFRGLGEFPGAPAAPGPSFSSFGQTSLKISKDPVGAPIFYRDVPLLPTRNEKGLIMPLAEGSLPLIEWRLRDLSRPEGEVVLKNMPTCANCHSFSDDGRFLGMDMDGPSGDKGSYALAAVQPQMVITNEQVFSWNTFNPTWVTFGLFSRVSPDGRYVVSAVNESVFVTNYLYFRFLQTFYPTRGILGYYDRVTGKIQALPGADDPEYVQGNAVWTPDGKTLVFIRAKARDSVPAGPRPVRANDPNEIQIQYDLCTIPFNGGRGGTAVPIPGASGNGMSNSFPKVSPDGRWLVWVQARTGLLMRPDSELYIMPLAGGTPRRMSCNLSPMNSWHSFSPNGRWLVFASKAFTPYTQMFLTHIDEQGNDSPAVLVPGSTASNRAVNIPEFVNIRPGAALAIDAPAVDYRRHLDRAAALLQAGQLDEAYAELQVADTMKPGFAETVAALGYYYREKGDFDRARELFEKAIAIDPLSWAAHDFYGIALFRQGQYEGAVQQFQAALRLDPLSAQSLTNVGALEFTRGNLEGAKKYFREAIEAKPTYAKAHFNLAMVLTREGSLREAAGSYEECLKNAPDDADAVGNLAWLYATSPDAGARNGKRALELGRKFELLMGGAEGGPRVYDILAAAAAEDGRFPQAVEAAETAIRLSRSDDPGLETRRRLLELYRSGRPFHGGRS